MVGSRNARRLTLRTVIAAMLVGTVLAPTTVRAGSEGCDPPTPQQAVEIIDGYVHPFVTNDVDDAAKVQLHPDVRRTNLPPILPQRLGGPVTVRRAEELRAEYITFPPFYFVTEYDAMRVYVDGCSVVAFFWLNFETSEAEPPPGVPPQIAKYFRVTSHIGLRAWINRGLIEELELLQARSEGDAFGNCWPANGDPQQGRTTGCQRERGLDPLAPVPGCVPAGRAQLTGAARSYMDAVASRDASGVPLAETARRTQMPPEPGKGPVTGTSAAEVRDGIEASDKTLTAVRNVRWTVEEGRCHVIAHWLADVEDFGTRHHVTRFMVSDGLIHEIEDIWVAPITPGAIEGSCWPKLWSAAQDETYRAVACPPMG